MLRTKWLIAAVAAGWMGAAAAQGAGAGGAGGAGKDQPGSAGTEPSPRTDMNTEMGTTAQQATTPRQAATAAGDEATTLAKLHAGHDAEVQAGSWMEQHATNSKVKDFAKKMVKDHGAMDKDLQAFAQKHDISLTGIPSVDSEKTKHKDALDELKTMTGAQADRHYMQMMVQDHTKDVSEVKTAYQEAKQGKDKDYSKLLGKTEKTMASHLKDAHKISRDLGARQARTPANQ